MDLKSRLQAVDTAQTHQAQESETKNAKLVAE